MRPIILALCTLLLADGAVAQECSEIRFARGAYSGDVSGQVADGRAQCFSFGSGAGQIARLQLFGSNNACFGVVGVVDCQTDFSFGTRQQTYFINVFQLFPRPVQENFTLRLTIQ